MRIALSLERRRLNASVTAREREVLKAPAEGIGTEAEAVVPMSLDAPSLP